MRIDTSYNYKVQPSFQYWNREVFSSTKEIIHRNDTCFFREKNFFLELANFLSDKFKNVPKANIYCYGCSDGSEPLSIAMQILSLENRALSRKLLPIIAKDIDKDAIKKAKKNDYIITTFEKKDIEDFTYNQYNRFFLKSFIKNPIETNDMRVIAKRELFNSVEFSVGDIFEDYKKINPKNSVLIAKNFWPYIKNNDKRINFFKDLFRHFETNSYFVIGEYDKTMLAHRGYNLDYEITQAGFKKTPMELVYIKE